MARTHKPDDIGESASFADAVSELIEVSARLDRVDEKANPMQFQVAQEAHSTSWAALRAVCNAWHAAKTAETLERIGSKS